MPLTSAGKKTLKAFQEEYGKKKGTNIFYAFEHKHPELVMVGVRHRKYKNGRATIFNFIERRKRK